MSLADFKEEWNQTEITTVAPNEQVFVTIRGTAEIRVAFAPGYYERATAGQLEEQLARTARKAFAEWTRTRLAVRSRQVGLEVTISRDVNSSADREFFERRDTLAVEGSSGDGTVSVFAVGMREFTVTIAPGVLDRRDSASFAQACGEAATTMLRDQVSKMRAVRLETYP